MTLYRSGGKAALPDLKLFNLICLVLYFDFYRIRKDKSTNYRSGRVALHPPLYLEIKINRSNFLNCAIQSS